MVDTRSRACSLVVICAAHVATFFGIQQAMDSAENAPATILSREDLVKLNQEDLVDKVISMQAHIKQLKGIINKLQNSNNGSTISESLPKKKQRPFDFSRYKLRHIFLRFLYLGAGYDGFVVQDDTLNTVEERLFEALLKTRMIRSRETANYHRCGRTDKGVSAFCQVVSLTVRSQLKQGEGLIVPEDYSGEVADTASTAEDSDTAALDLATCELDYVSALNGVLPRDIRVIAWAPIASTSSSARFDCRRRRYHYYFPRGQLDISRMNDACQHLLGQHDFRNLCKMDVANGVLKYVRRVFSAGVSELQPTSSSAAAAAADGSDRHYAMCLFQIEASAFLWHQIRCIMAVLFLVGLRREEPSIVQRLLDIEVQQARPQYGIAPDHPLVLYSALYDSDLLPRWLYGRSSSVLQSTISTLHEQWTRSAVQAAITHSMIGSLVEEYNQNNQPDCLNFADLDSAPRTFLAGVNSRTYRPLLSRPLCDSLERRLEKAKEGGGQKKRIKLQM